MEEARHGGLIGVGIGEGIDKQHLSALDELVVMAIAIYPNTILIDRTCKEESGVLLRGLLG